MTMTRNSYGALNNTDRSMIRDAIKRGLLPAEYIDLDKRGRGTCLNIDVYDATISPKRCLVQIRETTITKYGASPRKSYALLSYTERRLVVRDMAAHKPMIAKLAKASTRPGEVIRTITGEAARPLRLAPPAPEYGYKALAIDDGQLRSIYSGRAYHIGGTYRQTAKAGHKGGYYYYHSEADAMSAMVPDNSVMRDARRVIVRVKVAGKRCVYDGDKYAASRMTILSIVREQVAESESEGLRYYWIPDHASPMDHRAD